ncbi:MAG: nucleotidyltransferase domain-containing protein [Pyrodictiaceae archaeon]
MREKIERRGEYRQVIYSNKHWELLRKLRAEALKILSILYQHKIHAIVHGSIARGDVKPTSDIDVFIPNPLPPYLVELILEKAGYRIHYKVIVQATPSMTPKAYIVLDEEEKRVVSFPLAKLSRREYEFYFFGGALDYNELSKNKRVPGVDKRLVLIEPTEEGHLESPVIGREAEVARKLNIEVDTVLERVRVLSRRDEIGRTGVFLKHVLDSDEPLEDEVRRIAQENTHFRRILISRGSPFI